MKDVIVIGAGAAGLIAAGHAAQEGLDVLLLERNEKPGRKIGITGKGRCNVTNNCDENTCIANLVNHPRFMYSAIYGFPPSALMKLIEANGTPLKTERGSRVFPVSDRSFDIIDALVRYEKSAGAHLECGVLVESVTQQAGGTFTVKTDKGAYESRCVIVATGGLSYPTTGSTGTGYEIASSFGLNVIQQTPGLIPLTCEEPWCRDLMGLSLKNVRVTLCDEKGSRGKTKIFEDFGEMLFTHFGVSGPVILSSSSYLGQYLREHHLSYEDASIRLFIDLKPALTPEKLDERLIRDFEKYHLKAFEHALCDLLPHALIPVIVHLSGIDPQKKADTISRAQRLRLGTLLKALPLHVTGTRPIEEAVITQGGVDTRELDPSTMMCRKVPGLFFCGEVIDVDGLTGGFNLQTAFSSGYASADGAARFLSEGKRTEATARTNAAKAEKTRSKNRNQKTEGKKTMLNVAIDGPSGAGKSTVAREAAAREGLHYVDTGALYRAVGYVLSGQGVDLEDEEAVSKAIKGLNVRLFYTDEGQRVSVDGTDVTPYLRSIQAGDGASKVSAHACVREHLLNIQRQAAEEYDVIMDGRDIGTVVLPHADVKFYITASLEERTRRRVHELDEANKPHGTFEEVRDEIIERDYRDTHREVAPLRQAEDAIYLDTTQMSLEEVADKVCGIIEEVRKSK